MVKSATAVLGSYARRAREIDRVILPGFVLGPSIRKIGEILLPPARAPDPTHHRRPRRPDIGRCHRRPLTDRYKAPMLDGVVLARRATILGASPLPRPHRHVGDHRHCLAMTQHTQHIRRNEWISYHTGLCNSNLIRHITVGNCGCTPTAPDSAPSRHRSGRRTDPRPPQPTCPPPADR